MVIHHTLNRRRRALGVGLSALLAPAVLVACGGPGHGSSAGDAAGRPSASAPPSASPSPAASTSTARSAPNPSSPSSTPGADDADPTPTRTPAPQTAEPSATRPPGSPSASATAPATPRPSGPPGGVPVPGSVLHHTASGGRTVALTFDDGPGPATGAVLDLLARYGAHATFCQVGKNVAADPAMTQRILAGGHRLCDHTVDHPQPMHALPHDRQVAEIADARDTIVRAGGPGTQVTWWRAPGGDFTAENVKAATDLGMKSLGWTVDPRDWSRPGVPAIVATVQKDLRPGGVVLMHDGGGDRSQTVAALAQLLPWLVAQGYTFDFPAS
ncbi:hypothetical protein GCM10023235_20740 [Kitasatospora terrestris]|uniref:NodB homology domain-containing protein n=1 Tax=Kitasatospora terrestris TaxID=258051 RepID=A0ABP9DMZ8_9ACTN